MSNRSRIGYENLLENGTVVASAEDADYPVENCFDWNTADYFRPDTSGTINVDLTLAIADNANYLAIFAQDLYLHGGTIKLQYHNGSTFVDASATITPSDNSPQRVFFNSVSATRWRLVIACTNIFNLGAVSFGEYLELPYGMYLDWTPPRLARANKSTNNISETGAFLGKSVVSKGLRTTIELLASDAWVRTYWEPFMEHLEAKPFFWCPNFDGYPTESAFCWLDGDLSPPKHAYYGYMRSSVSIGGLVE
jgi:hypothetical protein